MTVYGAVALSWFQGVHTAMPPGSFTVNAAADAAVQAGGEMTLGASNSITLSA